MANKFKLWVENDELHPSRVENSTQNYSTFLNDSQRQAGFQSGEPASSIRVNTALRQANLVACALMDVVAPNDQAVDLQSDREDVAEKIKEGLTTKTMTISTPKITELWSAINNLNNRIIRIEYGLPGTSITMTPVNSAVELQFAYNSSDSSVAVTSATPGNKILNSERLVGFPVRIDTNTTYTGTFEFQAYVDTIDQMKGLWSISVVKGTGSMVSPYYSFNVHAQLLIQKTSISDYYYTLPADYSYSISNTTSTEDKTIPFNIVIYYI